MNLKKRYEMLEYKYRLLLERNRALEYKAELATALSGEYKAGMQRRERELKAAQSYNATLFCRLNDAEKRVLQAKERAAAKPGSSEIEDKLRDQLKARYLEWQKMRSRCEQLESQVEDLEETCDALSDQLDAALRENRRLEERLSTEVADHNATWDMYQAELEKNNGE